MLTAFVTGNSTAQIRVTFDVVPAQADSEEGAPVGTGPNPIAPEPKELVWGAGSFIIFFIIMRLFLVPKLRQGMASRYESIRADHEYASSTHDGARADVSRYEGAVAEIRAQAAQRLESARQTLDKERQVKVTDVNAKIAERRATAEAEIAAQRRAAQDQVLSAVTLVTTRVTQIAVGTTPDAAVVQRVVQKAMEGNRS